MFPGRDVAKKRGVEQAFMFKQMCGGTKIACMGTLPTTQEESTGRTGDERQWLIPGVTLLGSLLSSQRIQILSAMK